MSWNSRMAYPSTRVLSTFNNTDYTHMKRNVFFHIPVANCHFFIKMFNFNNVLSKCVAIVKDILIELRFCTSHAFDEALVPDIPVQGWAKLDPGPWGWSCGWIFKDLPGLPCVFRRTSCSQCCQSTYQWRWSWQSWSAYKTAKIKRSSSASSKITTSTASMWRGTRTSGSPTLPCAACVQVLLLYLSTFINETPFEIIISYQFFFLAALNEWIPHLDHVMVT